MDHLDDFPIEQYWTYGENFHSKLVLWPCLTRGLRLKPRLAQVEQLNVVQRHAANFAWNLERTAMFAVKTCDNTWQKNTRILSLSLNLSRFIPISLELIQIHLNSSEPPDLSRFIKIYYDSSLIHHWFIQNLESIMDLHDQFLLYQLVKKPRHQQLQATPHGRPPNGRKDHVHRLSFFHKS